MNFGEGDTNIQLKPNAYTYFQNKDDKRKEEEGVRGWEQQRKEENTKREWRVKIIK